MADQEYFLLDEFFSSEQSERGDGTSDPSETPEDTHGSCTYRSLPQVEDPYLNYDAGGDKKDDDDDDDDDEKETEQKEENAPETKVETVNSQPTIPTLEELANSDFIHNRQLAAKSIVEYLHQAGTNKDALHSVISVMCKLLEDEDLMVRSELMEHIPSIALFCKQRAEDLGAVIRQQIVPYTVKLITDVQFQIRKIGHTTLLVLLENKVIDNSHLTEWICPLIAQLVTSESDPEDVSVMCLMIPFVGKEITEKFFLEPFLSICCDRASSSREVCMHHFGELSKVLGRETTESVLLPVFLDLCQDAQSVETKKETQLVDIAVDLATVVSPTTRHEVLSRVYLDFLNDEECRSVSYAAHLSLGRFISTFADPSKTGLCYKDGIWIDIPFEDDYVQDQQNNVNFLEHVVPHITPSSQLLDEVSKLHASYSFKRALSKIYDENSVFNALETDREHSFNCEKKLNNNSPLTVDTKDGHLYLHIDNENLFNNFQFWRTPLPEVELDIDIEECKSGNISVKAKIHGEEDKSQTSELNVRISSNETSKDSVTIRNRDRVGERHLNRRERHFSPCYGSTYMYKTRNYSILEGRHEERKEDCLKAIIYDQNIVPAELLVKYVNYFLIADEMAISYAYYFPSVAYTLGRQYWQCIRSTFQQLATSRAFNVRKSVASSLHELSIILGRDITNKDLFPVFCDMLEVEKLREIVLKNVSRFLKNLRPCDRKHFLQLLKRLCIWEEERDWRYRFTVAEQLIPCISLYSSCEALFFFSVSLTLLEDKVCAVRKSAVKLLAVSLCSIVTNPKSPDFLKAALNSLNEKYRKANKWLWRQMYVYICQELAVQKSLPTELYIEEIVPNLFALTWDTVPNVRLAVARCLVLTLLPLDYLPCIQKTHNQLLLQVIFSLESDADDDVRHFAQIPAAAFNDIKQFVITELFPDVST